MKTTNDMEINKKSTFSDLNVWFVGNWESLPVTLIRLKGGFHFNVKATVTLQFNEVNREVRRLGADNLNKSSAAVLAKKNLYSLYCDLQVRENWNAPRPTYKQFKNSFNEKMHK